MPIQGLNNTLTLRRETMGVDDAIGGATLTESNIYTGVRCRVSNPNRGDMGRIEHMEGVDVLRVVKIVVYPSHSYIIEPTDVVILGSGRYATDRFIVLDVKQNSILHTKNRAHLELICERYDEARTKQ